MRNLHDRAGSMALAHHHAIYPSRWIDVAFRYRHVHRAQFRAALTRETCRPRDRDCGAVRSIIAYQDELHGTPTVRLDAEARAPVRANRRPPLYHRRGRRADRDMSGSHRAKLGSGGGA